MLFGYELKKIWRRVSPLLVLVVLLLTAVSTVTITQIFFNHTPTETSDLTTQETAAKYAELADKIENWNENDLRNDITKAFNKFYSCYKTMNASVLNGNNLVPNYNKAKDAFNGFYCDYYQRYIKNSDDNNIDKYLLVQAKYEEDFDKILLLLDAFFDANYKSGEAISSCLQKTNTDWEDASLQDILDNLFFVQTLNPDDLTELQEFFTEHRANQENYDYTDAYEYALHRFWIGIATARTDTGELTYTGKLSQYKGFEEYVDVATSTRVCVLADFRLAHPKNVYAAPFAFGNIFNNSNQISLFDFVFTNMEMAMIPLALLVMIWAACTFFTDNYQNTLITPVAVGKKRSTIIVTKMLAVMTLVVAALLILVGVYLACGLVLFHSCISPDILFLFNGTQPLVMSAANYFAIYFLNLVFKLLPLIAICGLFSFTKTKPFVIIGFTVLICATVMLLNLCLGGFGFYQFIPLMGLDPIRYFGAELLFAPMPSSYNLWYTFPVMLAITVVLYLALIRTFRHHDF